MASEARGDVNLDDGRDLPWPAACRRDVGIPAEIKLPVDVIYHGIVIPTFPINQFYPFKE
jgi:hypothetical protein